MSEANPVRSHIPWAEPRFWGNEEKYAVEALRSTWISGGPYVERLERDLARTIGAPDVVSTSNGTTALLAAFIAIGIGPGDEVVVPGFAFMAAANMAIQLGAKPTFCDVDPDTWCMTADAASRVISPRTRAIVPVHTYGNICDMDAIMDLAERHGFWTIEDAAEALGSTYNGRHAGTIASIGTYSLHATKTITTGEGGAVATSDPAIAEKMRLVRSHGVSQRRYWHDVAGHNLRLTNLQAAIGCAQLEMIDEIRAQRLRVARRYRDRLADIDGAIMQSITPGVKPLIWAVAIRLDERVAPNGSVRISKRLDDDGIETRPGFHAASEMKHLYDALDTPCASALAPQIISLPSSPSISNDEIDYICDRLAQALPDL